jgi:hypothetical protein
VRELEGRAPNSAVQELRARPSNSMHAEDIDHVVRILKREIKQWPVPALAKFAETPFTVLISCILSLRTQDKTTLAASNRLFEIATTPPSMLAVPLKTIERTIYPVSFYRTKARTIHEICRQLISRFGGRVPADLEELLSLPGVGRKTANIVVTLGFQKPGSRSTHTSTGSPTGSAMCGPELRRRPKCHCGGSCLRGTGSCSTTCSSAMAKTSVSRSAPVARCAK